MVLTPVAPPDPCGTRPLAHVCALLVGLPEGSAVAARIATKGIRCVRALAAIDDDLMMRKASYVSSMESSEDHAWSNAWQLR